MVAEHKHKIGFTGTLLIEPKPQKPTKHQYDYDTASVYGFLKQFGLEEEFKVNIEANRADLFHGHIGGMDHMALALKKAALMLENDFITTNMKQRYASWSGDLGCDILAAKHSLESLAEITITKNLHPKHVSGQQELLENTVNRILFG